MEKERLNWNSRKQIYSVIKRIMGFILALFGIIILSPIMLLIAIIIKLDSEGPVIFKQARTGKNGKVFMAFKFRTMVCDNNVHDFSKSDEHTRVGTILRKLSLDELPQLFNILNGTMSFIGPRPWITDYYDNMSKKQRHRYDVAPGITGLAQAKGRNNLTIFQKINYDIEYAKNVTFKMDVKVFIETIKTVLSKTGAEIKQEEIQDEINLLKVQ